MTYYECIDWLGEKKKHRNISQDMEKLVGRLVAMNLAEWITPSTVCYGPKRGLRKIVKRARLLHG